MLGSEKWLDDVFIRTKKGRKSHELKFVSQNYVIYFVKKKWTQLHYKSVNAKNPKKQKKTKKQLKKQEDIAFDFFYIL